MGLFVAALSRCKRSFRFSSVQRLRGRRQLDCEGYGLNAIITLRSGDIMLLPVSCALSCKGFAPVSRSVCSNRTHTQTVDAVLALALVRVLPHFQSLSSLRVSRLCYWGLVCCSPVLRSICYQLRGLCQVTISAIAIFNVRLRACARASLRICHVLLVLMVLARRGYFHMAPLVGFFVERRFASSHGASVSKGMALQNLDLTTLPGCRPWKCSISAPTVSRRSQVVRPLNHSTVLSHLHVLFPSHTLCACAKVWLPCFSYDCRARLFCRCLFQLQTPHLAQPGRCLHEEPSCTTVRRSPGGSVLRLKVHGEAVAKSLSHIQACVETAVACAHAVFGPFRQCFLVAAGP